MTLRLLGLIWVLGLVGLAGAADSAAPDYVRLVRGSLGDGLSAAAVNWLRDVPASARGEVGKAILDGVRQGASNQVARVLTALVAVEPGRAVEWTLECVRWQPEEVVVLAEAAGKGAPGQAPALVSALGAKHLARADEITVAVSRVAPDYSDSILLALGDALPGFESFLERAKTLVCAGRKTRPSVALVVWQAKELAVLEGEDLKDMGVGGKGAP